MGAWGVSLFADDTACDVRDEYQSLREQGVDSAKATLRILSRWHGDMADLETGPVVLLALAATQWKWGSPGPALTNLLFQ